MMDDNFSQLPSDSLRTQVRASPPDLEHGVEVPYHLLETETLDQLIHSFVLREGTDYGQNEVSLRTKRNQIRRQLETGESKIVFDLNSESGTIVPTDRFSKRG